MLSWHADLKIEHSKLLISLKKQVKDAQVEFMELDVHNLLSVKTFVQNYFNTKNPLHILVNNAGVNEAPLSPQGFNGIFATNYLGPYYLTKSLYPLLKQNAPSRVVNVSSYFHRLGRTNFYDSAIASSSIFAYPTSKLAQLMMSQYMHGIWSEIGDRGPGSGVSSFSVHPGPVNTNIYNGCPTIMNLAVRAFFLTKPQGALTTVYACVCRAPGMSQPAYFTPYNESLFPLVLGLWQPSCMVKVRQSKSHGKCYDRLLGAQLMALSDQLIEDTI